MLCQDNVGALKAYGNLWKFMEKLCQTTFSGNLWKYCAKQRNSVEIYGKTVPNNEIQLKFMEILCEITKFSRNLWKYCAKQRNSVEIYGNTVPNNEIQCKFN